MYFRKKESKCRFILLSENKNDTNMCLKKVKESRREGRHRIIRSDSSFSILDIGPMSSEVSCGRTFFIRAAINSGKRENAGISGGFLRELLQACPGFSVFNTSKTVLEEIWSRE